MTWTIGSERGASHWLSARSWLCFAVLASSGCSCDGTAGKLTVTDPAADAELTRSDDADAAQDGVQYDVEVTSRGLSDGTEVELFLGSDEDAAADAEIEDGKAVFAGVTLLPGVRKIRAVTASGIESDAEQQYTLRALEITSPLSGRQSMDASQADDFQLQIEVSAFAVEDAISIRVDGDEVGDPEDIDETGKAQFTIDLAHDAEYTIDAIAGDITSEPVVVDIPRSDDPGVVVTCDNIDLVAPELETGATSITLGGDDCPEDGPFTVDITLATDAGSGNMATLEVNGQPMYTATVEGSVLAFEDVVLDRREDLANRLSVRIDTGGDTECERDFDIDFFVDCAGPSCEIESPLPVAYDEDGQVLNFLNADSGDGTEFDVVVKTSASAIGQTVELIVDGDARNPIEVTAVARDDDDAEAVFSNVELPEGVRTVEAKCVDDNDNQTFSAEEEWTVDVSACEVVFAAPTDGAVFGPSDDADSDADGQQVEVELDLSDADCVLAGVEICDPTQDITPSLSAYDGTSALSVTLEAGQAMQDICVELVDRAGNSATGSVGVSVLEGLPMVTILSPADGDRFNALGNDAQSQAYEADSDPSTDVCEANIRVECSVIGADVTLLRGAAGSEAEVATEACAAPGSGDTDVTAGAGIAVFSDVDFLGGAAIADGARLIARQTLSASSGDLVAETTAITLTGDCGVPDAPSAVSVTDATGGTTYGMCPAVTVEAGLSGMAVSRVVVASDAPEASLTVTQVGAGAADSPVVLQNTGTEFVFDSVQLGDGSAGMGIFDVVVRDAFNNEATVPTCQVTTEPLEITAPADGTQYVTSDANCGAFPLRARVTATFPASYPDGTMFTFAVSGGGTATKTVTGGGFTDCVVLSDGSQTITITMPDGATDSVTVESSVQDTTALAVTGLTFQAPDPDQAAASDNYRTEPLSVTWDALPTPPSGSIFWSSYEMRCAGTDVNPGNPQNWWDNATAQTLTATVPDTTDTLPASIGKRQYCVLRACDIGNRCTGIPTAGAVAEKPFRRQLVLPPTPAADSPNWLGSNAVPVGDINGDGLGDVLVAGGNPEAVFAPPASGSTSVFLYFGKDVSPTDDDSAGSADAPDVVFSKARDLFEAQPFGRQLAGLGDINGDGIDDFAIAAPNNCDGAGCGTFANVQGGAVYIFFGRAAADPWPSSLNVGTTASCGADICLVGSGSWLGAGLAALGAFDTDDGVPDLAVGAIVGGADTRGEAYVLSGASLNDITCGSLTPAQAAPCARPSGQSVWGVSKGLPADLADFVGYRLEGTAANANSALGSPLTAVGNADGVAGNDLVLVDQGSAGNSRAPSMLLLSGRSFGTGVVSLDITTDVSVILTPPLSEAGDFGFTVSSLGNVWDAPGTPAGAADLGVYTNGSATLTIYPGTNGAGGFDGTQTVRLGNDGAGGLARWTASGQFPALGLDGSSGQLDLDGDGTADICVGARGATNTTTSPTGQGEVYIASGDTLVSLAAGDVSTTYETISPPVSAVDTRGRSVNYLGDVTGDGHPDLAVGDVPAAIFSSGPPEDTTTVAPGFPREGALWILY